MSEASKPVSIEFSNGWFFAIIASLIVPWLLLPDRFELVGLCTVIAAWSSVVVFWMRKDHIAFVQGLSSLDVSSLSTLASNYRIGSIRQRAVRAELAKRTSHTPPASH